MVLLRALALETNRGQRSPAGGLPQARHRCSVAAVAPFGERLHDALVIDIARRGEHDVGAGVRAAVIGQQRPPGDRGNHLGAADHRPAERVRAEDRLGGQVVDHVLRIVLDHRDLFEHDLSLRVDVGQGGLEDHVRHHVERNVDVVVGHAGVDDGGLARRGRIELATHRVEQLGDLDRVVALGALEEQMLDEVRHPCLRDRLVAGAGADPEPDRRGADAVYLLGDDALPAGEGGQAVGIHVGRS